MLGRIIGAAAGSALAKSAGAAGPMGAVVGAALPTVLRRFGPLGMIAAAAGLYVWNKRSQRDASKTRPATVASTGGPPFTPPG